MFNYIVRRLLLMIPTFIGTTILVFFILMNAPGNPFDKALQKLTQQSVAGSETVADSAGGRDDGNVLSDEAIEQLRKQYSLDKPIAVRYLVWIGAWPRLIDDKTIDLDYPYEITDLQYLERYKISNPGSTKFKIGQFVTLKDQEKFEEEAQFLDGY